MQAQQREVTASRSDPLVQQRQVLAPCSGPLVEALVLAQRQQLGSSCVQNARVAVDARHTFAFVQSGTSSVKAFISL